MFNVNVDVDAMRRELEKAMEGIEGKVRRRMDEVGARAVEIAKETGTYHDVTGRLRSSNKYKVGDRSLTLYNDAPYAEEVEARGEIVLTTAALEAERMLNEDDDNDK